MQHGKSPLARLSLASMAAAALAGIRVEWARDLLDELAEVHLLEHRSPDRFAIDALLRRVALRRSCRARRRAPATSHLRGSGENRMTCEFAATTARSEDGGMAGLTVWVDRGLWLFLPAKRRCSPIRVAHDGTATAGHVVESLGVPLPEVGVLLVDGAPSRTGRQPGAGATIEVFPVERPQPAPARFLLDVHFGKLARRMRLLGIDTSYRNDADDDHLIEQAAREDRVLLTQDRGLLRRRALRLGAYVRGSAPDEQLADVLDRFAPPLAPWTRCTACNGELTPVSKEDVAAEVQPGTRRNYHRYARCRECARVYWRGAHARRIDRIIRAARLSGT